MGVWEGIFKGSEAADARKERDKDFALKTKIFDENKRMGRLDSLSKYVSTYQNESGGSSFTGTGKKVASLQGSEHYINILSDMGIDQDAIERVAGTGARNLQSVVTQLSGAAETFLKNNGRDAPLPLDIFNTAISGAILTQPSGPTIDMDEVQKAFGIELSQSELLMIKPAERAPSLTMKPGALTITQVASLEDLGRIDKQGIQYSVSLGNSELAKLTKRSAQLVTLSEQGALDDVTTAEQAWVTQRMTEVQGAIMSILADSYEKETYEMIALSIADGMPVGDLTSMILQAGFQEGKWNPDLMLMLIEPTMYILASIAEQCDIDYLLYRGDTLESYEDEEDESVKDEKTLSNFKEINKGFQKELGFKDLKVSKITKDSVPEEALEVIEDFEPPKELVSLLARKKEESNNSLLERT